MLTNNGHIVYYICYYCHYYLETEKNDKPELLVDILF